jgi:hypothetical protein
MKFTILVFILASAVLFSQNKKDRNKSPALQVKQKVSKPSKSLLTKKNKNKPEVKFSKSQGKKSVVEKMPNSGSEKSDDYAVDGLILIENKSDQFGIEPQEIEVPDFFATHFKHQNIFSASLVSRDGKGKLVKGNGAKPSVQAGSSPEDLSVTFHIELRYQLDWYYQKFVPSLIKFLDPLAIAKIKRSVSINIEKKGSEEKHFMQPTRTRSFPIPNNLWLQKHSDRLVFSNWNKILKNASNEIFIACNLGRDHRGKNQRFAIYQLPSLDFQQALDESVARIIPPLQLDLKDANGSIIRQDRWFPRNLATSKSPTGKPDTGELHTLSYSSSSTLYESNSASYQNPLSVGLIKRSYSGRIPCYVLAPWFTYESGNSNRNFYSDAPVLSRSLIMSSEDLEVLRKIKLYF